MLREFTRQHGVVLIFDEVVTGFRVSRAEGNSGIGPRRHWRRSSPQGHPRSARFPGHKDIRPREDLHQGTFNANPLSAARVAALEIVGTTDAYTRANRYSDPQSRRINEVFEEELVTWAAHRMFALAVCWGVIREGVRSVK